jgi:hypothetical protein
MNNTDLIHAAAYSKTDPVDRLRAAEFLRVNPGAYANEARAFAGTIHGLAANQISNRTGGTIFDLHDAIFPPAHGAGMSQGGSMK